MNSNAAFQLIASRYLQILLLLGMVALLSTPTARADDAKDVNRIQPCTKNPRYWQYKGEPVMLLGASKTDHLFLIDDLEAHLDEMHSVGANYVRNTMSQRESKDLKPYKLLPDGMFDIDQWNEDYWNRFENFLRWTAERDLQRSPEQ